MTEFKRWHKWFIAVNGRSPTTWEAWNGALQYVKESRPTVRWKPPVQHTEPAICPRCDGRGHFGSADLAQRIEVCPECHGTGKQQASR